MATSADGGLDSGAWLSGIVAGLVATGVTGLAIQFVFDPAVISSGIAAGVGSSGLVAGWAVLLAIGLVLGLVYAVLSSIDTIHSYAVHPGTGAPLGLIYGMVVWVLAVLLVPLLVGSGPGDIGGYGLSLQAILSFALLGVLIGLGYGTSPATG